MLPKEFKPDALFDLLRVGKNNDGGYLICKKLGGIKFHYLLV